MSAARPDTWMPTYWGDYARDTAHLNATLHGAYLMLIKHYWCTGKALQDDDAVLWRVATCDSPTQWRKLRPTLAAFFLVEGGLWQHKRVDAELERAAGFTRKQTENGRKGGRPPNPNKTQTEPSGFSGDNPNETKSQPPSQSQEYQPTKPLSPEPGARADGGKWGAACKAIIRSRWPNDAKAEMMGTGLASQWIADGYDLELDVLPIVRQIVADKRGDAITTLNYFHDAIGRRHAERTAPRGEEDPDGEAKVRTMLENLYAQSGRWDEAWNWRSHWGARPDKRQAAA